MSHDFEQLTITYSEKSLHFLQPAGTSRGVYHERKFGMLKHAHVIADALFMALESVPHFPS